MQPDRKPAEAAVSRSWKCGDSLSKENAALQARAKDLHDRMLKEKQRLVELLDGDRLQGEKRQDAERALQLASQQQVSAYQVLNALREIEKAVRM